MNVLFYVQWIASGPQSSGAPATKHAEAAGKMVCVGWSSKPSMVGQLAPETLLCSGVAINSSVQVFTYNFNHFDLTGTPTINFEIPKS